MDLYLTTSARAFPPFQITSIFVRKINARFLNMTKTNIRFDHFENQERFLLIAKEKNFAEKYFMIILRMR